MSNLYPDSDFPWSFYFNGELMPKWGACWGMAQIADFVQPQRDADQDLGYREVHTIYCRIDHVGVVESADLDQFIYVIQEVLHILLSQRDSILVNLHDQSPTVYPDLVEAAFSMRMLAVQHRCAFWTTGYEADRTHLLDVMRRCNLPSDSPQFLLPPHVQHLRSTVDSMHKQQVRKLHQLAQSGLFDKVTRRRLHELTSSD